MDKVSVIVPVYMAEKYISKCIESVLRQDYTNFELILVVDGSPDHSGDICEKYAEKDDRIRVFRKENGGPSDARNYGLEKAVGEYYAFVDADDYVETTYLSYLSMLINKAEKCLVSQANHFIERGKRVRTNTDVSGQWVIFSRKEAFEAALYHDRIDVSGCGKLYHKSVFSELRFPKGQLYEDTYIFGDVLSRTENYVYGFKPQYHYVINPGSIVNRPYSEKSLEFILAVERLTDLALTEDKALEEACCRRRAHSCLSVLRYMEQCRGDDLTIRDELRDRALQFRRKVCHDPKAPERDKAALRLLKLGYLPFYTGWHLYNLFR